MSAEADAAAQLLHNALTAAIFAAGGHDTVSDLMHEEARNIASTALDALLARPDDLLAVMGMEHVNANVPDDRWCEVVAALVRDVGVQCHFGGPPHKLADVFVRPRTEGGTDGTGT